MKFTQRLQRPWALGIAVLFLTITTVLSVPIPAHAELPRCERRDSQVAMPGLIPTTVTVAGWYCSKGSPVGKTAVLMLHGGGHNHQYADLENQQGSPFEPETYSFVKRMTREGFVVYNIDRIGAGASSHPPATDVTVQSEAAAYSQLVTKLRNGTLGQGTAAAPKVIVAGHSLGSAISIWLTSTYGSAPATKIDGLLVTGFLHIPNPAGTAAIGTSIQPAQIDPKFASAGLPLGYFSPIPANTNTLEFTSAVDPDVVTLAAFHRDTSTSGQLATFPDAFSPTVSLAIHDIPVLVVVGEKDPIFCDTPAFPAPGLSCANAATVQAREATNYANACLESGVLPNASHSTFWHPNTDDRFTSGTYPFMADWAHRWVGTVGHPATQSC